MSGIRLFVAALVFCFGLNACADQPGAPAAGIAARSAGPINWQQSSVARPAIMGSHFRKKKGAVWDRPFPLA
ncbi:MAG: hypothetical protein NTX90_04280 [Alphaproteobacteria bacterium]|nr:hypothetical protein [Alphaproteobacteria bacterium]